MEISSQTLILVANKDTLSDVNKEIVKETLKYMFKSTDKSKSYFLTTYSHESDKTTEEFSTDYAELCIEAENLQFEAKETSLVDTLTFILSKWQEADFACRNIVVFTDGIDADSLYYDKEELFYTIENTNYPIYIVDLVEEDNFRFRKSLSAISKTSGGKMLLTEYEGSDAQIEKEIGNSIFDAMNEYAASNWNMYEANVCADESERPQPDETYDDLANVNDADDSLENDISAKYDDTGIKEQDQYEKELYEDTPYADLAYSEEEYATDEMYAMRNDDYEEGIVYLDEDKESPGTGLFLALGIAGLSISVCIAFVFACLIYKKKKENRKKEAEYKEIVEREVERRISSIPAPTDYGKTVFLGENIDKCDEYSTRILQRSKELHEISFEDVNDPSRFYTVGIDKVITVGRIASCADVCIDYDDSVSARHFEIRCEDEHFYIADLGSSNGTYLNATIVNSPTEIFCGDMISIGMITLIVRF